MWRLLLLLQVLSLSPYPEPKEYDTVHWYNPKIRELIPLELEEVELVNRRILMDSLMLPNPRAKVRIPQERRHTFVVLAPANFKAYHFVKFRTRGGKRELFYSKNNPLDLLPYISNKWGFQSLSLSTYDLKPGEYCFSPVDQNTCYSFGVDKK